MQDIQDLQEYVDGSTLAVILGISRRTIERHSINIAGRIKIGGAVRYHLPEVRREIFEGRDPLKANTKGGR